jgi:Bacterial CdiA-CT RNAse A domain
MNRLPLVIPMGKIIGEGVVRLTGKLTPMTRVRVILKYEVFNGQPYYILTAYPCL